MSDIERLHPSPIPNEGFTAAIFIVIAIIMVIAYGFPTLVAFYRGHPQRWGIAALNLFGGWTGYYWHILLARALDVF